MTIRAWTRTASAVLLAMMFSTTVAHSDEGMWLFNNPPRKLLQEKFGFNPTDAWLEHVQKSSVRFNSGGSGSFVSADGLVMTNHHVGADCLQKLGDKDHNYYRDGFHAKTRAEEKRCHDLELDRKSTRLNSSHTVISYAVFCLKKKKTNK